MHEGFFIGFTLHTGAAQFNVYYISFINGEKKESRLSNIRICLKVFVMADTNQPSKVSVILHISHHYIYFLH